MPYPNAAICIPMLEMSCYFVAGNVLVILRRVGFRVKLLIYKMHYLRRMHERRVV